MIEASGRLDAAHRALVLALTVVALLAFDSVALPSANGSTAELVSLNSAGTGSGNNSSGGTTGTEEDAPNISANERFVAFESRASDLVANDTNGTTLDVFVRDLQTNTTTLVSVRSDGMSTGNGNSLNPTISDDGRFVAFQSQSSDLVANDTNGAAYDVFVRDLQTNTTVLVSINTMGTGSGNKESVTPVISENGQFVAFVSSAGNLVTIPVDGHDNIFVRDLNGMTTALASVNASGNGGGNAGSSKPVISADGKVVAFQSSANDLASNDSNSYVTDIFARDLQAATTTTVSANAAGTGTGNGEAGGAFISKDGKVVAFLSLASDLLPEDTNPQADVYARDLQTGTLELVSANMMGVAGGGYANSIAINADGRYIAFQSQGNDLVPNDHGSYDIFVRDRVTDTTEWVSIDCGVVSNAEAGNSFAPAISDDGRFVSFESNARNLTRTVDPQAGDVNLEQVFVRDLVADTTALVSLNSAGTSSGNYYSRMFTAISADGRVIAFASYASDLVTNDTNGHTQDVFAVSFRGGLLEFSDDGYSINEGGGTLTLTVNRKSSSMGEITIAYDTMDDTAQAGSDYPAVSGTLTFADGETSKTVMIPITDDDNLYEGNETFIVRLKSPMGEALMGAWSTTQVTIIENDSRPKISINDVTVTEGNSGFVDATFTVSLSNPSTETVSVAFRTVNGTATANADYIFVNGSITFGRGVTSLPFTVQIPGDTLDEATKTFFVNLYAPDHATIADGHSVCTILDNDPPPTLRINDVAVNEGNAGTANAVFKVILSNVSGQTVKVHYATANGTAHSGSDYTSVSGTLTFPAGETNAMIIVPVKGDLIDEANETFLVNLSSPVNATIFDGRGTGTITDNDTAPRLAINNVTVTEGDTGAINASFTVSLSAASGQVVTVHFATDNGTATAPADYTAKGGTLSFTPGQTTKPVVIQVKGDTLREPNETFKVNLNSATNATFSDAQGIGTIINND